MLAGGAALGLWAPRSGRAPGGLDAIVMMELAYLPNVVLCVLVAWEYGELQIGAYAVLLTATAYVVHALAVVSGRVAPVSVSQVLAFATHPGSRHCTAGDLGVLSSQPVGEGPMSYLLAGIFYLLISEPGIAVYRSSTGRHRRSCGAQPSVRESR